MRRTGPVLIACMALAACASLPDGAHGQASDAQFWVVTELGNVFHITGPPPDRPPGFDSAPFLNVRPLDTILSLTAGPAPGVEPVAIFGEAGTVTELPEYDPGRKTMDAAIVLDWGVMTNSIPLYVNMPVGDLNLERHTDRPYLGPARVGDVAWPGDPEPVDLLEWCNTMVNATNLDSSPHPLNGTLVSCVDNRSGGNLTAARAGGYVGGKYVGYGHVLDLQDRGRTIIHVNNNSTNPHWFEVMLTCPFCMDTARAYHGFDNNANNDFMKRGFRHDPAAVASPDAPYRLVPANLTGLAWDGVADANHIWYWQDGGSCTPTLSISGGTIQGGCTGSPNPPIEAGTVLAETWQPLYAGWNAVDFPPGASYIIVVDPGPEARLQIREANQTHPVCCTAFDGGVWNNAPSSMAAVIHNTDRHLLLIPYGGSIPPDHATLADMQGVRLDLAEGPHNAPRQIAHSEQGDPVYHGIMYGERGEWPPYKVRMVEARHIDFEMPHTDILEYMSRGNYTQEDLQRIVRMGVPSGPLMDSQIYDIRNNKLLRTDEGRFILWDGSYVDRPYIQPWMNIQESPVWEMYGVELPDDELLVVDTYATIPTVRPTTLSGTYLSSLPCGYPNVREATHELRDVIFDTFHSGMYDPYLMEFLLLADHTGDINDNLTLQLIYEASRTYLDYLDGFYYAGEEIHVPILGNRPYLCTVIAPNILVSQYILYGLPYGGTYLSLGGTEAVAEAGYDHIAGFGKATHTHHSGVQAPRSGALVLDVDAKFWAGVSALGTGDAHTTRTNATGQWLNGTWRVEAVLEVAGTNTTLATFDMDLHEIHQEAYLFQDGRCYARFTTLPDVSPYVLRSVTVQAAQGEHVPVSLHLTATPLALAWSPICDGTTAESILVQFYVKTFAIDVG